MQKIQVGWVCTCNFMSHCLHVFFKKGQPLPLYSFIFGLYQTNIITNFTANICEKMSIRCWDLNPRPSEHESSTITTRLGLPPCLHVFYSKYIFSYNFARLNMNLSHLFACRQRQTITEQISYH